MITIDLNVSRMIAATSKDEAVKLARWYHHRWIKERKIDLAVRREYEMAIARLNKRIEEIELNLAMGDWN